MVNFITEDILKSLTSLLCMIGILSLIGIGLWNLCLTFREGISYVKRLHQIPCSRCAFFTGDYRLKCTVHPDQALTETALNCHDYEPTNHQARPCFQQYQSNSHALATQEVNYRIGN